MTRTPPEPSEQSSNQKTGNFVYVVAAIAALGGLLFGYDTGAGRTHLNFSSSKTIG